jgi:tetrapyrrole methylase family protein / MazG family protein
MNSIYYSFEQLRKIMAQLRAPNGCPWDREQTHDSIKGCLLEEAHEFLEAIDLKDDHAMAEELGDLLLQVVFHAEIAAEEKRFTLDEVIHEIAAKLVRRHPHVFGEVEVANADEVVRNWEAIKNTEVGKEDRKSRMDGIPPGFPALLRAHKLQTRAAKDGFDWPDAAPVWEKIAEEEAELREAIDLKNSDAMEDEYGDLLFACVNLGRKLGIDSETALLRANRKFESRYRSMEALASEQGQPMAGRSLEELDALWMAVKKSRIEANRPNP